MLVGQDFLPELFLISQDFVMFCTERLQGQVYSMFIPLLLFTWNSCYINLIFIKNTLI